MPSKVYQIEGWNWMSLSRAAELLGTSVYGIGKLMAEGKLDWRQTPVKSRTFVVDEQAVLALRKQQSTKKLMRSPDSFAAKKKEFEPERRVRGGLWQAHHLRLTLPMVEDDKQKKP